MRCPKGCLFPMEKEKSLDIDVESLIFFEKEIYFCTECSYEFSPKKTKEIQEIAL